MIKDVQIVCAHCGNKDTYDFHWSSSVLFSKCKECKKESRFELTKGKITKSSKTR